MNTTEYLNEEIARLYAKMAEVEPESEEYGKLEARWTELVDRKIEIEKTEVQTRENRKDRFWRNAVDLVKVGVPLAGAAVMTLVLTAAEAKGVMPCGIGKKWVDKMMKF